MFLHIWKAEIFYYENLIDDTLILLGNWNNQDGIQDGHHKKDWYYAV